MKRYIVSTHLGDFETWATSPAKAISNVRYRIFGRGYNGALYAKQWTAKAA